MPDTSGIPPALRSAQARRARLRAMKHRATALLGAVSVVFAGATVLGGDAAWAGYLRATAEAAMIGGLADWFAVTALFRHPVGLPIPHTAIVAARKDSFAATLGEFIEGTFLTPDAVIARLRDAGMVDRLSRWLSDPAHAGRLADELIEGVASVAELLRDEDVHRMIEGVVRDRVETLELAPLAGRALAAMLRDGHHQAVLDVAVRELDGYLDANRAQLRARFGQRSPWWLPGAAEDRIVERLIDGARALLAQMVSEPGHPLRAELEQRLARLAADLQSSPELIERGEKLKRDLLAQPQLAEWVASLWRGAKESLRDQAAEPASPLRQKVTGAVMASGARLSSDPVLVARLEEGLERATGYVIDRFGSEIGSLVEDTIGRWDAEETSDRLELLLGPDLQYIRINGTVVGAAAGLGLHAIADLIGH